MTSDAPAKDDMTMEQLLNEAEAEHNAGAVVTATVVDVTAAGVLVDVGLKGEGFIPLVEFRSAPKPPAVGDSFPAVIKRAAGPEGHALVSWREARERAHWGDIQKAFTEGIPLEGTVVRAVKGGLIVDVTMEAFLPASQVDRRPVRNLAPLVGQKITVLVLEMDPGKGGVVVSHRKLLEKEAAAKQAETLKNLAVGSVVKGRVTSLTGFGAFVDLGGIEGLLRISDVSWGWVGKLTDILHVGEEIETQVIKFDPAARKIALSRKALLPKPWDTVEERYPLHSRRRGKVTSLTDFGAFVEMEPGVEGLVHQTEFSWRDRQVKPTDVATVGEEVEVVVLSVNRKEEKMALSLKRAGENPWEEAERLYTPGTRLKGTISHLAQVGAFVRLPSGIEALLRTDDISWTKTPAHPKEVFSLGQEIEAVVLDVKAQNERLALGVKQLAEDPYKRFTVGEAVEGTVSRLADNGAYVSLGEDIEGFVPLDEIPADHRVNHPSEALAPGQAVSALVTAFQRKTRSIVLSIRRQEKREERRLLKQYRASDRGVSLADLTGWDGQLPAEQPVSPPET
jgi:small subunit ribosomal protein S1